MTMGHNIISDSLSDSRRLYVLMSDGYRNLSDIRLRPTAANEASDIL